MALEYRPQTMPAPVVDRQGHGLIALRIKEVARWHNIPIVENPPLAQALYRATEVGEVIPAKLYTAVAEILAFLYRTQASCAIGRWPRAPPLRPRTSAAGVRNYMAAATQPRTRNPDSTDWLVPVAAVTSCL